MPHQSTHDPWNPTNLSGLSPESAWTDSENTTSFSRKSRSNHSMPDSNIPINDDRETGAEVSNTMLLSEIDTLKKMLRSQQGANQNNDQDPHQVVIWGNVKPTKSDSEMIVFYVNLFLFKLVFIVNIPGEGENRAKIYMKFRLSDRDEYYEKTSESANRRQERNAREYEDSRESKDDNYDKE